MVHPGIPGKKLIWIAAVTALLLLIPLAAMQFTDEVVWTPFDFIVAGLLLFGAGLSFVLLMDKMDTVIHKAAAGLAVLTALALVWVNLAVGIIGSEDNPANLMYIGVLAVAIIGSLIARFRPKGMSVAMFVTAAAQILVSLIAVTAGLGMPLFIDAFFALLWAGSALLFRYTESRK